MFCNHCGAKLDPSRKFCDSCGKEVVTAPVPLPSSRVARHVQLLAILWLAFSAMRLLRGGSHILGAGVARHIGHAWFDGWGWPVAGFLPSILSFSGITLVALAAAGLAAGWGLMERRPWARTLAIVMAIIALFSPILGTALGIFTLWVLGSSQAEGEYRRMARS